MHAPATFQQDASATAVVVPDSDDDLTLIGVAVEACPTRALQLNVEEEG